MYLALSFVSLLVFAFLYYRNPSLRRPMVWAGLLSLPLFALKFLITPQFWSDVATARIYWLYMCEAVVFGFTFGGIAAVIFELLFHKKLKTVPHPHRIHLNWLVFGPIAFLLLEILSPSTFGVNIALGFFIQAMILIYLRKDLLWDALLSGVFLGIVYMFFYYVFFTIIPGQTIGLWFSEATGIMFLGVPVEEFVAIFAFGLLWGPLYEGVKGYALGDEK